MAVLGRCRWVDPYGSWLIHLDFWGYSYLGIIWSTQKQYNICSKDQGYDGYWRHCLYLGGTYDTPFITHTLIRSSTHIASTYIRTERKCNKGVRACVCVCVCNKNVRACLHNSLCMGARNSFLGAYHLYKFLYYLIF